MSDDHPHVVVFPPLLFAGALLAGLLLQWLWPFWIEQPKWIVWLGPLFVASGIVVAVWARRAMSAAGTDPNPRHASTAIATGGPYRFTRNPMYLSMAAVILGIGLWARAAALLLVLIPFALIVHFGIVRREERYLDAKFGETYRDFRQRVSRYL